MNRSRRKRKRKAGSRKGEKRVRIGQEEANALFNQGVLAKRNGDMEMAITCYEKVLACYPKDVDACYNLGEALATVGRFGQARDTFRQTVVLNPNDAQAWNNLGFVNQQLREMEEAGHCYQQAIAIHPFYGLAHKNISAIHLHFSRITDAIASLCQAIRHSPTDMTCWQSFASLLKWSPESIKPSLEAELTACLQMAGIDKRNLATVVPRFILEYGDEHNNLKTIQTAEERALDKEILSGQLLAALNRPIVTHFLENVIAADPQWELLMTVLRRRLLFLAIHCQLPEAMQTAHLGFMCALAAQCFLNEYAYFTTDSELADANALVAALEATMETEGHPLSAFSVALAAAYFPLFKTPLKQWADRLSAESPLLAALMELQVHQPLREQALKFRLGSLTAIVDPVSKQVRDQYEENPYPRWKDAGFQMAQPLQSMVKQMFGHFQGAVSDTPKILVAGCGTGRHAINCAQAYESATVTAIDISKTSLAYGERRAEELGLDNIHFLQGDLLEMDMNGGWDLIESVGVLHHLNDPLQGLRHLASQLKPEGVMKIGLYSETARKPIETIRRWAAANGCDATETGIRAFRHAVLSGKEVPDHLSIRQSSDFYSLSACRDLFFHVQEHRFTLLEIKRMLETLTLELIGFELEDPGLLGRYRKQYPLDETATDLEQWHQFEQMHPSTFAGMYQFWVKQKVGS